jgi:hypothetical protein
MLAEAIARSEREAVAHRRQQQTAASGSDSSSCRIS